MAITGPAELPVILKVDSDPTKMEALSTLGHPIVLVEAVEPMLEQALRSTCNWVSGYFPKEERYAYFMTEPLRSTYPLPQDAYWVRNCAWDPVTTRINDIFGAESFLFCQGEDNYALTTDGLLSLKEIEKNIQDLRADTPYGPKKMKIKRHEIGQPLIHINYGEGELICTPNHPIKIDNDSNMIDGWLDAEKCDIGTILVGRDSAFEVKSNKLTKGNITYTLITQGAECFYGCRSGESVLIH